MPATQSPLRSIAATPDGNHIVGGSDDQMVRLWDAGGVEVVMHLAHPAPVGSVAITSDGRLIASGSADGIVRVWDRAKVAPIELKGHRGAVNSVANTPDGSLVVSGSNDGTVRLWNIAGETRSGTWREGRGLQPFRRDAATVRTVWRLGQGGISTVIVAANSEWHRGCLGWVWTPASQRYQARAAPSMQWRLWATQLASLPAPSKQHGPILR